MDRRVVFQNIHGREQESGLLLVDLAQLLCGTLWHGVTGLSTLLLMLHTATFARLFLSLGYSGNPQLQLSSTRRLNANDCHALVIQLASTPGPELECRFHGFRARQAP